MARRRIVQVGVPARIRFGDSVNAVVKCFVAERERWALWAPVLIGAGIAVYFSLVQEPVIWVGAGFLAVSLLAVLLARRHQGIALSAVAAALFALGFTAVQIRTHSVAAPVLERSYGPGMISGRVLHVDTFPSGARALLDQVSLRRVAPEKTPARVRIRLRASDRPAIGSRITVYGKLMPPARPAAPGAYDFQRHAWYLKIGAVGFAYGKMRLAKPDANAEGETVALWISRLRQRIGTRILAEAPGDAGAVAAALVMGDRSAIPRDVMAAMRDSGLAHLLAISGLHMGLVAAILFFGLRSVLAGCEPLVLRYPVKKWAALAALLGGFGYLILTGATIPTQRAFMMTGLVLVAVMLDRTAISLRLVAWAAAVILLISPESLLSASFQMSFAAVVALVAVYESGRRPLGSWASGGPFRKIALYAAGVALTTIVAGFATGVFGMYHFGRITHFGLLANLFAVPATAFWIMPWAVVTMALMPFGLEALALAPMTWGIDIVLDAARFVAGLPNAVSLVPAMSTAGLVVAALGGLWLCLWRYRWRYIGLVGVLIGVGSVFLSTAPDVLISEDGRLMAIRAREGDLVLSTLRREKRTARIWLSQAGQRDAESWRARNETIQCDGTACIYRTKGLLIALVNDPRALEEDCHRADVIVSAVPVRGRCPSARLVIDRFDLWWRGGHAVRFDSNGINFEAVVDVQGERPWSSKRPRDRGHRFNNAAKVRSAFLAP
jgi:competence protein ComEC